MDLIPDLGSLDSAAAVLDQHASELRGRVAQLGAASAAVQWASTGADAFRAHSEDVNADLLDCATRLEHAAFELRRHAATARERLHELSDAVVAGANAVIDTGDVVLDLVGF